MMDKLNYFFDKFIPSWTLKVKNFCYRNAIDVESADQAQQEETSTQEEECTDFCIDKCDAFHDDGKTEV